ncbi:hypothetical protein [Sulfurovum riftiae]|uniref:YbbD head domain-containing protein n=1 Tax=Sulfurovum riftiae TaxID=1630136 RepID=A0A151CEL5_9BACT|nr:hypothetical protein [Sulfurovum riftiae]KYJ85978.1 hypothetical protein AS592_05170 [Sulfurovum riftiae]
MFTLRNILIAMLLFFVAIYFLLTSYFSDVQINKYPDLQAVKEDKAIEKGWVPDMLPDSAYDIEETHDLDTNQLFGRFYYKEADEGSIMEKLTIVPDMNQTYEWKAYLFKVDREKNQVKYRNKPLSAE